MSKIQGRESHALLFTLHIKLGLFHFFLTIYTIENCDIDRRLFTLQYSMWKSSFGWLIRGFFVINSYERNMNEIRTKLLLQISKNTLNHWKSFTLWRVSLIFNFLKPAKGFIRMNSSFGHKLDSFVVLESVCISFLHLLHGVSFLPFR